MVGTVGTVGGSMTRNSPFNNTKYEGYVSTWTCRHFGRVLLAQRTKYVMCWGTVVLERASFTAGLFSSVYGEGGGGHESVSPC